MLSEGQWAELAARLTAESAWPEELERLRPFLLAPAAALEQLPQGEALLFTVIIYKALESLAATLSGKAPVLLASAHVSPAMLAAYEAAAAKLEEVKSQLSAVKASHVQANRDLEEADRLRASIAEIEGERQRWKALASDLDGLREQLAALENAMTSEQKEAGQLERLLQQSASALIRMREEQMRQLRKPTAELLQEANRREEEYRQISTEAKLARKKYEEFSLLYLKEKKDLEPYLEADRRVAEALGGEPSANQLLDRCRSLLEQADEALARTLKAQNDAGRPLAIGFGTGAS